MIKLQMALVTGIDADVTSVPDLVMVEFSSGSEEKMTVSLTWDQVVGLVERLQDVL